MCIDAKVLLSKTTQHARSTFQNYRLEYKLLQELGDEILIIISNTLKKTSPFIKFIWKYQHLLEFITTIVQKSTTVYNLHNIKQGMNS